MSVDCPFCNLEGRELVWSSEFAVGFRDGFPVSQGHTLIVPRRHVATYFEVTPWEQQAVWQGVRTVKDQLDNEFAPAGYNVGFNDGEAAGQTVMHLHVHVIPRFEGDVDDPRGGVRGVIQAKQKYDTTAAPKIESSDP
jgi:diadenosine tetraphosphate (Ap4A) HIT family hydrolase